MSTIITARMYKKNHSPPKKQFIYTRARIRRAPTVVSLERYPTDIYSICIYGRSQVQIFFLYIPISVYTVFILYISYIFCAYYQRYTVYAVLYYIHIFQTKVHTKL
jgi:hypothetical protein